MKRIFISHSHLDIKIADSLFDFLIYALKIEEQDILCTSDPESGLTFGSDTISNQLKENLKNAEALIVLITPDSLNSVWIPFEIGSFWPTDKPIIIFLGSDLTPDKLPGPLKGWLSIRIADQQVSDQINAAINQLARKLKIETTPYNRRIKRKIDDFISCFKDWKSKRPNPNAQYQKQITELQQELSNKESIINQLQEKIQQLESSVPNPKIQNIELKSEKGVDYTKLRDLLAAGEWKNADQETYKVMLQAANRFSDAYLRESDINKFPCDDLRTIDQLWVHYSKGKFGFSVQKKIYVDDLGGTKDYNEQIWNKFSNCVGWKKGENYVNYEDLIFELRDTYTGHLPSVWFLFSIGNLPWSVASLAQRIVNCNISPSQPIVKT